MAENYQEYLKRVEGFPIEQFTPLSESEWNIQTSVRTASTKKVAANEGYEEYHKRVEGLVDFVALTEEEWMEETQLKAEDKPRFVKSVAKPAVNPTESYETYLFRTSGLPDFAPLSKSDWQAEIEGRKYVGTNEAPKSPQFDFADYWPHETKEGSTNVETSNQ